VHGNCQGISLPYLLLNLISATEQLTIDFFLFFNSSHGSDYFIEKPPTIGDWLNFAQLTLVWALHLLLYARIPTQCLYKVSLDPNNNSFIICLCFSSNTHIAYKLILVAIYGLFAYISIAPVFIDALIPDFYVPRDDQYRNWVEGLFGGLHMLCIHPVVTILSIVALPFQARAIRALPAGNLKAVSLSGFLVQGVVFGVVAISWTMRVKSEGNWFNDGIPYAMYWYLLFDWYLLVGWAAIDNGIFALMQIWLFFLARSWGSSEIIGGETEPLLAAALE
jgi:hypothetical protein